jgi:hypothetical protein
MSLKTSEDSHVAACLRAEATLRDYSKTFGSGYGDHELAVRAIADLIELIKADGGDGDLLEEAQAELESREAHDHEDQQKCVLGIESMEWKVEGVGWVRQRSLIGWANIEIVNGRHPGPHAISVDHAIAVLKTTGAAKLTGETRTTT